MNVFARTTTQQQPVTLGVAHGVERVLVPAPFEYVAMHVEEAKAVREMGPHRTATWALPKDPSFSGNRLNLKVRPAVLPNTVLVDNSPSRQLFTPGVELLWESLGHDLQDCHLFHVWHLRQASENDRRIFYPGLENELKTAGLGPTSLPRLDNTSHGRKLCILGGGASQEKYSPPG